MRGQIVGVIDGMNEFLIKLNEPNDLERGQLVELTEYKERRSKNANAMYWELNGRLAQKLNISGEDIYRQHIRDISCRECYFMETKAVRKFEQLWNSGHLGRFIETRESRETGRTIVLAYYGSSDFDKEQMGHLIDNVIQDCEANGVPTYNQQEINKAVEQWAKTHHQ